MVEEGIRDPEVQGLARTTVEQEGCNGKGLGPVRRGHISLEQQGASNVVERAKCSFGLAVLRGRVRAGHAEVYAVACKKVDEGRVNKLGTIVGLEGHDREVELCACIGDKVDKNITCVGFPVMGKRPHKMSKIINNDKVIFETRITSNR